MFIFGYIWLYMVTLIFWNSLKKILTYSSHSEEGFTGIGKKIIAQLQENRFLSPWRKIKFAVPVCGARAVVHCSPRWFFLKTTHFRRSKESTNTHLCRHSSAPRAPPAVTGEAAPTRRSGATPSMGRKCSYDRGICRNTCARYRGPLVLIMPLYDDYSAYGVPPSLLGLHRPLIKSGLIWLPSQKYTGLSGLDKGWPNRRIKGHVWRVEHFLWEAFISRPKGLKWMRLFNWSTQIWATFGSLPLHCNRGEV